MKFKFQPLEKHHALAILTWRYPPPYDIYNFQAETHQTDLNYLLDPDNAFFVILNPHNQLDGYCSFGTDGQVPGGSYTDSALDIGMGLRPRFSGPGSWQNLCRGSGNLWRTLLSNLTVTSNHCRIQPTRAASVAAVRL